MKANVEIKSEMLTKGLSFHGETYGDRDVVNKLGELQGILSEIIFSITDLHYDVSQRHEGSAKDIKNKIERMGKELGIAFNYEEG